MNALLLSYPPQTSASPDDLPQCHLVLLHDHALAAEAAHGLLSPLLDRCLSETCVHQDHWSFEELEHAGFRSEALELARPCDLMVLATINTSPFDHVSSWITSWTETRIQKDAALIYLTATYNTEVFGAIFQQTQDLQRYGNLTVFLSRLSPPASESAFGAPEFHQSHRRPDFLSCVPRPEGWGISE